MTAIISRLLVSPILLIGCLLVLPLAAPPVRASEAKQHPSAEDMPPGLRDAVSAALEREGRNIYAAGEHNGPANYEAINRTNDLRFLFDGAGVRIAPREGDASSWEARMTLAGFGYEGNVKAIPGLQRRRGVCAPVQMTTPTSFGSPQETNHVFSEERSKEGLPGPSAF